jgi:uncharacterized protein YkwD
LRARLVPCALLLPWLGSGAGAAPLNAVNYDRMHACGGAARTPLLYNSKLDAAARGVAGGVALQTAIEASGYLASQSSMLHLMGVASDGDIQRVLAAHYCRTLEDPNLRDFGVERRGREIWMVLAAPVALPLHDAASVSRQILELVNAARASGHLCGEKYFEAVAPLSLDPALTRAALAHANDMAAHDLFDHIGRDGSTPAQRVERAGYGEYRVVGENIAAGAMSPSQVTQGWLKSPAHCENIMDGRFTQTGIAFAENLKTAAAVFWAQEFAAHR